MRVVTIICLVLFFTACDQGLSRVPEPKDLIKREAMIDLMTEMVKLEGLVEYRLPGVNRFHSSMLASADSLFKAHGVSADRYNRSLEYYGSRQGEMQEMYNEVLERLGKEIGEIQTQ